MALRGTNAHVNGGVSYNNTVSVSSIGIQANDLVLLAAVWTGTGGTFTLPSGFNTIPGLSNVNVAGTQTLMATAYKVATGSEPTSYQITSSLNNLSIIVCRVYSGRNTSSPFTAVANTPNTSQTASIQNYALTGLTTAASDDLVEFVANQYYIDKPPGFAAPPGYSNSRLDQSATANCPIFVSCDFQGISAGATGTNGGQYTNSSASALAYAGQQISLAALNPPTITAAPGSFALIGIAATVGSGIDAQPGSFSFNGQSATLSQAGTVYELLAAPGSFFTFGANAAEGYELDTAPAAFALAGPDVPLSTNLFFSVQAGAFTLSGNFATLGVSGFSNPIIRVQAVQAGFYLGDYKDIGDVFDIFSYLFSDSTQSTVPPGDPDYPVYGWMLQVPSTTPLFSYASSGFSTPRNAPRRTVE